MFLDLTNIGLHHSLSIDFKPITILTGENNTGKSTIGKTLYALLKGSSQAAVQFQTRKQLALDQLMLEVATIVDANGLSMPEGHVNDIDRIEECLKLLAAHGNSEAASRLTAKLSEIKSSTIASFMSQQVHSILQKEFRGSVWHLKHT